MWDWEWELPHCWGKCVYAEGSGCDIGSTMWVWIIDNLVPG